MLLWARAAAVFGISFLLMGSKIIIQVPAGGSVVSSSGLFACTAGEVCSIEVDERHFSETFTAIAAPGFEFRQWRDTATSICGGSRDPYCRELDNGLIAGRALTLSPSFARGAYSPDPVQPRFSVSSFYATRYYEVEGNTQEEVWAQLHGSANPLALDQEAGTKPLGHAGFRYQYEYQSEYGASAANCRVASGKLTFRFYTVLPKLAVREKTSDQLIDRWQPFQELMTEHEAGHLAIYRQLVLQLPYALTDIGEVPCAELQARTSVAVAEAVRAIRQASVDYDRNYEEEAYLASAL